ncbi:MAG TPA: tetratricopeptide repeat protein [Gemmatimonadaceae bacterium]
MRPTPTKVCLALAGILSVVAGCGQAAANDGKSADTLRVSAEAYLAQGQLSRAYQNLLKAQVLAPKDGAIRLALARIYLIEGRIADAQQHALTTLDSDGQNLDALALLAATASTPAEIDDAVRRLEGARSRFDTAASPRLALASLYQRRGDLPNAARFYKEAVSVDPQLAEDHSQSIRTAVTLALYGKRDQAKATLRGIAGQGSSDATAARRLLAELALADDSASVATDLSGKLLQQDSTDSDALIQAGRARLIEQNTGEALAYLQKSDASLAPTHYYLATALIRANRIQEAREQLEQAIKLTGNYPEALTQYAALNVRGDTPRATIADADRLVKLNPRSLEARRVLGEALLGAQRLGEADKVFREAIRTAPDRPEPHMWLGVSLRTQGKNADARQELQTALRLSPALGEPMSELVRLDLAEGKSDSALADVTNQLRVAPQSAALYSVLGSVHEARKETGAAIAAFEKAAQLDPKLINPHGELASLYASTQKFDRAIAEGEIARKLDPRNVSVLLALGVAYQTTHDYQRAREAYEQALNADPSSVAAANNLAVLLSESSSDQTDALRYALNAIKAAPNDPNVKDTAGWILYKVGRYSDALSFLRESAQALPNSPNVQYHFGMAAQKTGDTSTARRALGNAVASTLEYPGKDDARKALALLK